MAEGFELYHIPQQSRRDKLRVVIQNNHTSTCINGDLQESAGLGLLPSYDQSSQNLLSWASIKPSLMAADHSSNNIVSNARTIIDNSSNESSDLQSVRDSVNDHCNFIHRRQHHDRASFHGGDFVALSLSSQNTHTGTPPVELNLHGGGGGGDYRRIAVVARGPYTGYGLILKGSKFLKPAQELLDEICDVGFGICGGKIPVSCGLMSDLPPLENLRTSVDDSSCGGVDKRKRCTLISLLDEVYKRYKHYYQQIQTVITSFESVSGLNNAAPFANLDIKAMSKHFHCLKNAITEHLQFSMKPHEHHLNYGKKGLYGQTQFVDHLPVWRHQRGLPKRAVTVLRSWLFDHFLHPYPTDTDKQLLAKKTGLSRNQVSNWFINARVRLWKPMVEEVHTLETRQALRASSHIQQQETSRVSNSFLSHQMNQESPSKRSRNHEFQIGNKHNNQNRTEENKGQVSFYNNLSIQTGNNRASANRGLPLTLGLRQNNNIFTLSETFPLNAGGGKSGFVVGGLDGRDIVGGRFVHDFGG